MGKIQIVKGSDTYTEGFKMKAVNPDGVLFRWLPNVHTPEKRREFVQQAFKRIREWEIVSRGGLVQE